MDKMKPNRILGVALATVASIGIAGCQAQQSVSKYFIDRGPIYNAQSSWGGLCRSVAFGDMDGDRDLDMVIAGPDGKITYHENTGRANNPYINRGIIGNVEPGPFGAGVMLHDHDNDGHVDIIALTKNGFRYFRNVIK